MGLRPDGEDGLTNGSLEQVRTLVRIRCAVVRLNGDEIEDQRIGYIGGTVRFVRRFAPLWRLAFAEEAGRANELKLEYEQRSTAF